MSQRIDRVDELLRQEIGAILEREVSDPRIGFVTVTRVESSPDLAHARVWVSIIGTPEERAASMRALEHAMPYVRRALGTRIRIKRIPALHAHLDESIERGARILELIDKVASGRAGDPLAPVDEGAPSESLPTPTRRRAQDGDAADDLATLEEAQAVPAPVARHVEAAGDEARRELGKVRAGAHKGKGTAGGHGGSATRRKP